MSSLSTGYKAGGFTSRATVSENVGPYEAEYVKNYETGIKANLLQNRLRISAAGFYADYDDLVGFVRRTNSTGRGNEPITANLGNVAIKGLEIESSWLLTGSLGIDMSVRLLDAKRNTYFIDLNNDGTATDNSHLDVLMAPSLTIFAATHHTWEQKATSLETRLDAQYQAPFNTFGQSNADIFYRPGTTLINGSISWMWGKHNHSISLFARNLGDKQEPKTIIGESIFPIGVFEPPRR